MDVDSILTGCLTECVYIIANEMIAYSKFLVSFGNCLESPFVSSGFGRKLFIRMVKI